LSDSSSFGRYVSEALNARCLVEKAYPEDPLDVSGNSSVLFTLGTYCGLHRTGGEPCVVLNKRSARVKQAGDLCFPGGRVSPAMDPLLGRFLGLPGLPLSRWPYWRRWKTKGSSKAERLSLLFATALREGLEEMRINPLGIDLLGPMPAQELEMFSRVIYPMVVWIRRQRRFFPNWEVERVVYVPLRSLLTPESYARYRLRLEYSGKTPDGEGDSRVSPCFVHEGIRGREVLWGATYRIVTLFLKIVFDFEPPDMEALPIVHGTLGPDYLEGSP